MYEDQDDEQEEGEVKEQAGKVHPLLLMEGWRQQMVANAACRTDAHVQRVEEALVEVVTHRLQLQQK